MIRDIAWSYSSTSNLKSIKSKTEIGSCSSFFGPSFFWSGDYRTLPVPAQNCLNYYFSHLVALDYVFQRQGNLKNLARSKLLHLPYLIRGIVGSYGSTSNLKVIKWKTDIGSFRSSFGPSFSNWEVPGPYSFLLQIIWNTAFPN